MKLARRSSARDHPQPPATQSVAVAAAAAVIARAHQCVPELVLLFENGLKKRGRTVFQRPLCAPIRSCSNGGGSSSTDGADEDALVDQVLMGFDEVWDLNDDHFAAAATGLQRGENAPRNQQKRAQTPDAVVFVGELGEWLCL